MLMKTILKTIRIDDNAWQILQSAKQEMKKRAEEEGRSINPTFSDAIRWLSKN
jgi:predicted CopG family antitoxin